MNEETETRSIERITETELRSKAIENEKCSKKFNLNHNKRKRNIPD